MARVVQLRIQVENKPGMLATICSELAKRAVNITAVMASQESQGGIRLLATPLAVARRVLEEIRIPFEEEDAIAVRVTDRPGALGRIMRKLAEAGVNVEYAYGSIVKGSERALIVVGVHDIAKAEKLI
ncbi:MAG TPA: ACT domain-containing protein [Terriglobales bacterium]|nr:ACT domain-containing protein [Terriglobales bacterium]